MSEEKKLTGYPSIDKPWLKYYSEEAINAPLPECTIYEYLWENNKEHLTNTALNYFGHRISYGELFDNIEKATKSYSALGLQCNDIVTFCAVTIPETIYSFYGLNRLGVICNMIDPRTSTEGIREYIREVESKVVVTIDTAYDKIVDAIKGTTVKKIVVISPAESLPQPKKTLFKIMKNPRIPSEALNVKWNRFINLGNAETPNVVAYKKNAPCVIVHTGGTTGVPKGVILSNDNMNAAAFQAYRCGFNFKRDHSWLNIMPPFIAYGIGNGLHLPLIVGMEVVLIPSFKPDEFARLLIKHHPNHIAGVPSHYGQIIQNKELQKESIEYLLSPIVGGDGMDISLEKNVNQFFSSRNVPNIVCKGYGMSEVAAAVCVCSSPKCNKIGSVGLPFPHTTMSVFDLETGKELPYYKEGEICMAGPNTMIGYFNNQSETDHVIKRHKDGLMWVHSGDLGYIDEDGFVYIKDRIKRIIIRHDGFKVFPSLIEKTVSQNKNVISNCAVGTRDGNHIQGDLPIVFVVLNKDDNLERTKKQLFELCKKELPEYAQPIDFVFIDKMPLTAIGKVDYRALEEEAAKLQ